MGEKGREGFQTQAVEPWSTHSPWLPVKVKRCQPRPGCPAMQGSAHAGLPKSPPAQLLTPLSDPPTA